MADIASVFHWPPDALNAMPIEELVLWQQKARDRAQAQNGGAPQP